MSTKIKIGLSSFVLILIFSQLFFISSFATDSIKGKWDGELRANRIRVEMEVRSRKFQDRWDVTISIPYNEIDKLDESRRSRITFEWKRDAGIFFFEGRRRGDDAYGDFEFIANKDFLRDIDLEVE